MSLGNGVVQLTLVISTPKLFPFLCNGVSAVELAQPIAQYLRELLCNRVPDASV